MTTLTGINRIPIAAIHRNNDIGFVDVIDESNNTVKSWNLIAATTDGTAAAVTGVTTDEMLVTDGFDSLQNGAKITIRAPRSTRTGVTGGP